ncbi:RNA-dependent RNA polymerase family protein, partial [Pyruvatibacter sp.]
MVELDRAMQGAQQDEGFDKEVLLGSVNLAREILLQSHSANLKNATVVALLQGLTKEDREKAKGVEGKDAARSLVMSRVTAVPNPAPPRQRSSQGPSRNDWDAFKELMPALKRTRANPDHERRASPHRKLKQIHVPKGLGGFSCPFRPAPHRALRFHGGTTFVPPLQRDILALVKLIDRLHFQDDGATVHDAVLVFLKQTLRDCPALRPELDDLDSAQWATTHRLPFYAGPFRGGRLQHFWQRWTSICLPTSPVLRWLRFGVDAPLFNETALLQKRRASQYPMSSAHKVFVRTELAKMVTNGILEDVTEHAADPTRVAFTSPILVVPKPPPDFFRLCFDGRELNDGLQPNKFKLETIACVKKLLKPNDYLWSFDLKKGYFQVPLHERLQRFANVEFEGRTYQYKVLPFGL